ncbi:spore coat putative kinase YutH [Metabacillus malikii]|uniref:Spore coat protein YutH n=1 Tax=Metabacillus malikii TaxID=1504265 RepID=A0ABT9ZDS3_9BACI|nr:spore coat protein YutH [Metabacillus malikii]MDQ0229728.1 spore coat protein YutH [Metabacillus malikii]
MKKTINEEYGIRAAELTKVGHYDTFTLHQTRFFIIPINHLDDEELFELYSFSQYMTENREPYIASMVLTKENNLFFEKDDQKYILVKCGAHKRKEGNRIGRNLAAFHQKGRLFPYQVNKTQRIGQWKYLWEKRLDQLESFWREKIHSLPLNQFERRFVESFPYYLGLAENAIQYLVDTELDDDPQPIDSGTICHQRFHQHTWFPDINVKLPTDWVFDHCGRDIAEYMRHLFFEKQDFRTECFHFLEDYDRTTPLSRFSYRLIYSRLLFPLHYFECIEGYYLAAENEKQTYEKLLERILNESAKFEMFLRDYTRLLTSKTRRVAIPSVDWLIK